MQKQILKAKIYSTFLFLLSCGVTVLGIILAASVTNLEVKLYGTLFILTGLISSILMFQVFYRLRTINLINAEINNSNCFVSWKILLGSILNSQDYFIQKYLFGCFIVITFHVSLSFLTRMKYNNTSFEFSENVGISIVLFIISFLSGLLYQLYIIIQIMSMIADYREYNKKIIFIIHLKESFEEEKLFKKGITFQAFIFIILSLIYYFLRLGLYSAIANQSDDTNVKVFSAFVIIQCLSISCLCVKVFIQLQKINNQILDQQSQIVYNLNQQCFTGWFVLLISLILSRKLRFWRNLAYILQYIQTIYGLIKFPFYELYTVTIYDMFTLESYLYCDTAIIVFLMGWEFIDTFARIIHSFKKKIPIFQFHDQSSNIILPEVGQISIEDANRFNQLIFMENCIENAKEDYGDCCFCLDSIQKGQRVYKLKCHSSHVFHYYCMSKWLNSHNTCPLCQQTIPV